jgi:flagellar hook assembly protein FlgD
VWIKVRGDSPDPPPVISVETFTGPSSTVALSLTEPTHVTVVVYDVRGKRVRTLVNGILPGGSHKIAWDGKDGDNRCAGDGVYFCRVKVGSVERAVKIPLVH